MGCASGTASCLRTTRTRGTTSRGRGLPRVKRQAHGFIRPPDLIIQDELHLISGPLGTMVGLYETAVDELATWDFDGKRVRPKVIASTATVRKAREQVHSLFQRQLQIFPPHGLDAADNFFARQRPVTKEKPGRRYMGICAPGASRPSVLIRVYVAFLTAAQRLRELYGEAADPWMTPVGYFNSLRELGGMRRLAEDDVRTRAFRVTFGELERPGLAQRDVRQIQELTSRASSSDIPRILDRMEVTFPDIGVKKDPSPIDVVLATNMLSVGVDVQRLGLMVVNGQPKTTAEYIQATSRVGRHRARLRLHGAELVAPARPLPLRDLRALPRDVLPARRGALGYALCAARRRPRAHRRDGFAAAIAGPGPQRERRRRALDEFRRRQGQGRHRITRARALERQRDRRGQGSHRAARQGAHRPLGLRGAEGRPHARLQGQEGRQTPWAF